MKNVARLPEGYEKAFVIEPLKNRKQEWAIWGADLLLALVMYAIAQLIWKGQALILFTHRIGFYGTWVILICGFLIYAILHEVVRGICIRMVTGDRAQHYDHTLPGVFLNTASRVYLTKGSFAVIALAPVLLLSALFVGCMVRGGYGWFWPIYLLLWYSLTKAMVDLWGLLRLQKLPADTLVRETGRSVTAYIPQK